MPSPCTDLFGICESHARTELAEVELSTQSKSWKLPFIPTLYQGRICLWVGLKQDQGGSGRTVLTLSTGNAPFQGNQGQLSRSAHLHLNSSPTPAA